MKLRLLLPLFFCAALASAENEIGFIEKFALAPDRAAVLAQLVPGTEDYYFYHALHFQNTKDAAKLKDTMEQWAKRFPKSEQRKIIENRAALLAYDADPQATLKFLRDRLNLQFNHVQEVRDQKPDLPVALDSAKIARGVFLAEALKDDDLGKLDDAALESLVRDKVVLRDPQRRALLGKLQRPDVPGLVELIVADLKSKESHGFGEFAIHRALLPEQLDALVKAIPALAENEAYVLTRLAKLAPSADADAEFDPTEHDALLTRMWDYVKTLSPAFNTLKATVLRQRLEFDRTRGKYDRALFLEYLKLPRNAIYVNSKYLQEANTARGVVDTNRAFADLPLPLPRIGNDQALVRDYFLHLLVNEESYDAYSSYVKDSWLKPIFAEAKIVNCIGDPEKWASLLTPAAFAALKDRVDVEFSPANKTQHAPADAVLIDVFVKNAPKVIVKIYEINTLSYFLTQHRQLNTDLSLDGLVANVERTEDFAGDAAAKSPFRRVLRTFQFPELKGRGAWVVEFIGGGKSSRALIRKSQWSVLTQAGPAGDLLTVLDETKTPVPDAAVWLDGRKFTPDAKTGLLLVPFTKQPGRKPVVLADAAGAFATLTDFEHHGEEYKLDAQFHVEREQLLAGKEATVAIRAALLVNNAQVSLDLLQDAKLTITSTSLDKVTTTQEVKGLKFDAAKVFTHSFKVSERTRQLQMRLTGGVDRLTEGGQKEDVSAEATWLVDAIDEREIVRQGHLSKFGDAYVYELLGKDGEPIPDQQVVLTFNHRNIANEISVPLRTDANGRIALGQLDGITHVNAASEGVFNIGWPLMEMTRTWPAIIHAKAGDKIEIPWARDFTPDSYSLLEVRGGTFIADRSRQIEIPPLGPYTPGKDGKPKAGFKLPFIEIEKLPPGDYSLRLRDEEEHMIAIRVSAAVPVQGWLLGSNRELELRDSAPPLHIANVKVGPDAIEVILANTNKFTRVHVTATRFLPLRPLHDLAAFQRFGPQAAIPERLPNLFSASRAIGDEFRYILERRSAQKYAGNLLARPGLLLNPWEKKSTDADALSQEAKQPAAATAGAHARQSIPAAPEPIEADADSASARIPTNLDFLATAAPALFNLVPDAQGIVRIDRKLLGDRQHVQVYAEDLTNAAWRSFALDEVPTRFTDLRLTRNLDPAKPFAEKKEVSVLTEGQTLTLADMLTSELETYDTLAGIHTLFTTLNHDENLAKFAWILDWPKLKDAEKHAKYSEFACHELNFFLAKKDPAFFAAVIKPYLTNKKDKTFLDDWLLGADLAHYLEPWAYARLNVVERALLGQRLPAEAANAARHLRELWELLPPDPEEQDRLFETALRGRALGSEGGVAAFGEARDAIKLSAATGLPGLAPAAPAAPAPEPASAAKPMMGRMGGLARAAKDEQLGLQKEMEDEKAPAPRAEPMLAEAKRKADGTDSNLEGVDRYARGRGIIESGVSFFDKNEMQQQRELGYQAAYYRKLGSTKEWAENNYYHLPIEQQNADLVTINAFWRDFAAWIAAGAKAPFLSAHVAEAHSNFTEMMLALAVLDLPFDAPKHTTKTDGASFTLTAGGPVIAFHKEIKPAAPAKEATELLVSQNFYRHGDRYRQEGNEKFDKYVTGEFLSGVVYGANVVVTNPTSSPQKLELLLQIPRGALPVLGSKATDSRSVRLEPYTTQQLEYFFYFPAPAAQPFPHYPVNVAKAEAIVGAAKPFTFKVVKQLSQIDKASWDYVSQYGTEADVFAFLDQNNVARLDLERVAWRARTSVDFFRKLVGVLEKDHVWSEPIYRYALQHNELAPLREWLRHRDDFLAQCGPWLDTKPIRIDPIERRAYEHLEYSPLINQRAHRLGAENRIANPVLRGQYQALLRILAHKPALDAMDEMSVVYYLFLQDRTEEALARFATIKPEALPTKLQHDYFRCYAAFYEEKLPDARKIAATYADYPVDRWRTLFAEVTAQLDEIEGKAAQREGDQPDREKQQGALAAGEPSFDIKVENRTLGLTWKNLREVTVNYYLMNPEFLFSANPFVSEDSSRFSFIKPTQTAVQKLPDGKDALDVPLPAEFAKANVLVEVLGAGQRKAQAYHANTFKLTLSENYGRLEVRDTAENKAVSKAYVKVYARLHNGEIRFFKDGYTDLRGKFDYASLNSTDAAPPQPLPQTRAAANAENLGYQMLRPTELGEVERLAILVLSDAHGAAVKEVNPPSE